MKRGFEKPTPEQVTAYARSIGYRLDGGQFVDYYDQVGWVCGAAKKPMADWQAAVRLWKRNAPPSMIFDPGREKYQAAMTQRRTDSAHLDEKLKDLLAIRSWLGKGKMPGHGDPAEEERRFLSATRDKLGPAFVTALLEKARGGS
jgi:hypothetical protein